MDFVLIKNNELTEDWLLSIAKIKSQHWVHPIESQIKWLNNTYRSSDTHIVLTNEDNIIAYVAITDLKITADKSNINALGISCLCVDKRYHSKGYGSLIMDRALKVAADNDKILCLLCKEELVGFYKKCGYSVVSPVSISVEESLFKHKFMIMDNVASVDVQRLKEAKNISIDRNF